MTAYLPCAVIVKEAARINANLVWEAMGRGPDNIMRALTTDSDPTPSSPITHRIMFDASATPADVAVWQGFANGDLPQIDGVWGEGGIISAAAAMEAINGANLQVYSVSGDVVPLDFNAAVMASYSPPLHYVPDDDI